MVFPACFYCPLFFVAPPFRTTANTTCCINYYLLFLPTTIATFSQQFLTLTRYADHGNALCTICICICMSVCLCIHKFSLNDGTAVAALLCVCNIACGSRSSRQQQRVKRRKIVVCTNYPMGNTHVHRASAHPPQTGTLHIQINRCNAP